MAPGGHWHQEHSGETSIVVTVSLSLSGFSFVDPSPNGVTYLPRAMSKLICQALIIFIIHICWFQPNVGNWSRGWRTTFGKFLVQPDVPILLLFLLLPLMNAHMERLLMNGCSSGRWGAKWHLVQLSSEWEHTSTFPLMQSAGMIWDKPNSAAIHSNFTYFW